MTISNCKIFNIGSSFLSGMNYDGGNNALFHNALAALLPGTVSIVSRTTGGLANVGLALPGAAISDALGTTYPQMAIFRQSATAADIAITDPGLIGNTLDAFNSTYTQGAFDLAFAQDHNLVITPIARLCKRTWVLLIPPVASNAPATFQTFRSEMFAAQVATYGASSNAKYGIIDTELVLGANTGSNANYAPDGVHPSAVGYGGLAQEFFTQANRAF